MEENIPYELGIMADARNYRRELLRIFEPFLGTRILEIGGGIGFFSELLAARPATQFLCTVEPDSKCRAELEKLGLSAHIHAGTAFDLPSGNSFSSIVSVNVLEHIEEDATEVQRYFELLRPGGYFCLFVPARKELYSRIDRLFGHYRRYHKKGIQELLAHAGFEVETVRYFNLIGYFLWWFGFVFLRRTTFNPLVVRLYDRMVFPVASCWERRVARPPIGQSLLVVARRPGL